MPPDPNINPTKTPNTKSTEQINLLAEKEGHSSKEGRQRNGSKERDAKSTPEQREGYGQQEEQVRRPPWSDFEVATKGVTVRAILGGYDGPNPRNGKGEAGEAEGAATDGREKEGFVTKGARQNSAALCPPRVHLSLSILL